MQNQKNDSTANREIRISRLLHAPVELVWEVWTNPDHIKNWWGPTGFTNTIQAMEVKPGGKWDLVMHGPDGTDYKNASIFTEVVKHKKIVYEHASTPRFTATIVFEPQGNKTHLDWQMLFDNEEDFLRAVNIFKAKDGIRQNVEKLEAYLKDNG